MVKSTVNSKGKEYEVTMLLHLYLPLRLESGDFIHYNLVLVVAEAKYGITQCLCETLAHLDTAKILRFLYVSICL